MIVVLFFRQGIMGTKELPDLIRGLRGGKKRPPRQGRNEKRPMESVQTDEAERRKEAQEQ